MSKSGRQNWAYMAMVSESVCTIKCYTSQEITRLERPLGFLWVFLYSQTQPGKLRCMVYRFAINTGKSLVPGRGKRLSAASIASRVMASSIIVQTIFILPSGYFKKPLAV